MTEKKEVWIWDALEGGFTHPGAIPRDRAAAKAHFLDGIAGPFSNQISRAIVLDTKGPGLLIERGDQKQEKVAKNRVLHWFEGVLILHAIRSSRQQVSWMTREFDAVLSGQRMSPLNLAISYVEQRLMTEAVTGASFMDQKGTEHNFRRRGLETTEVKNGDELMGFFKINDITGYMPPWEAFHIFGVYQDFYLVRWAYPFSEVDYSAVENGCGIPGATWEPDECLPPLLDGFRVREKRAWVVRKKVEEDREAKTGRDFKNKRSRSDSVPQLAKFRKDGKPLIPDVFRFKVGHDFKPDNLLNPDDLRGQWPKKDEDYPAGFKVASPPGFCFKNCNCMDDARLQLPSELAKHWLEEGMRTAAANLAVQNLSSQSFVRRRGQISGRHPHFEALSQNQRLSVRSKEVAAEIAREIQVQMESAMKRIPLAALLDRQDRVRIPTVAFQTAEYDYIPQTFTCVSTGFEWLSVGPKDGLLTGIHEPAMKPPLTLKVQLRYSEGCRSVELVLVDMPNVWHRGTKEIVERLRQVECPLWPNLNVLLREHLSKIYDFQTLSVKEVRFGQWLHCTETLLRMLRSLAFANLAKATAREKFDVFSLIFRIHIIYIYFLYN